MVVTMRQTVICWLRLMYWLMTVLPGIVNVFVCIFLSGFST